jgi:hypothetical protein
MLKRYLLFLLVASVVMACSKDKLSTKPSIRIKNINTTEVFPGTDLRISLEFKDKEGDLGGGILTYIRNRTNIKPIPDATSNDKNDTVEYIIPIFPKTSTGDIDLNIQNSFLSEDPFDNDTMFFKIFVKDVAGNLSDTVQTESIVERQN